MSSLLDWFDEAASGVGDTLGDLASSVSDMASDVWSNVSEGVSDVFSGGELPDFIGGLVNPSSDGGASYSSNYATRQGFNYTAPPEEKKGWDDMFTSFVSNNQKTLLEMGFGAVAGMAKASAAKDAAKAAATASSDAIAQRDQLEQDANKRFSSSITGMAPAKKMTPKPLTRLDGSRVFTPTGLINTGAK